MGIEKYLLIGLLLLFTTGCKSEHKYGLGETANNLLEFQEYLDETKLLTKSYPEEEKIGDNYILPAKFIENDFIAQSARLRTMLNNKENRTHFMYEGYNRDFNSIYARDKKMLIQYISNGKWYILISRGYDGKFEHEAIDQIEGKKHELDLPSVRKIYLNGLYDPTNGLMSRGDIYITSENFGEDIKKYQGMPSGINNFK